MEWWHVLILVLIVAVLSAISCGASCGLKDWIDRHGREKSDSPNFPPDTLIEHHLKGEIGQLSVGSAATIFRTTLFPARE